MRRGRKAKSEKAHLGPHRPRCVRSGPPMLHMFSTVRLHILARIRTTKAARAHRPDIRDMRDLQAAGGFDASRLDPGGPDGLLRDRSANRGRAQRAGDAGGARCLAKATVVARAVAGGPIFSDDVPWRWTQSPVAAGLAHALDDVC